MLASIVDADRAGEAAGPAGRSSVRQYEIHRPGARPATRREQLLAEAARLFATRGFRGVGIDDIGAAAGISGPGIYRHFGRKEEILAALLVGISQHLLDGGIARADRFRGDALLDELVAFHLDFSLAEPDLIVLQDRDLDSLEPDSRTAVRRLQRGYVTVWADALRQVRPDLDTREAALRAHAGFGLLNSTPHLDTTTRGPATRDVLARMARAALTA